MSVTVKMEGFKELELTLEELANEYGDKRVTSKILVPAVREAMQPVLQQARANAPVDTGGLVLSLQVEARRPTKRDKRSKYVTEKDTVIAAVTTASGKKLQQMSEGKGLLSARRRLAKLGYKEEAKKFKGFTSDARAIAQEFGTAQYPDFKPYLRPALETNLETSLSRLRDALAKHIDKFKSKVTR